MSRNYHLPFVDAFTFSSNLFKSQDLKHLELNSCEFHPPPKFKGFHSLVTLNFQIVTFKPMPFQVLLSSSQLLERVSMVCYSEFDSFIIEAPNLKIFELSSTTNSRCIRRTPLLEEIVLGMSFNMSEVITFIGFTRAIKWLKSMDMNLTRVNKTKMEFLKHVLTYATALEKTYVATSTEIRHRGMKMMEKMK
ncbi:hypothetical protein H5410_051249 [Solanum commersonii]|uniref:F-box/LRR-repeat protein 15/At3g58940/PEG3-like LRR domain-containing protein n=1 Tax=Solanum commersonii TaxID=4109 RepID=A0A9J5X071_SOLCO|nr:hypothetical protein H5410_051249 [Solanum commersonii]